MKDKKMRILFLPRWYPDKYDPMPGLFVEQLAESLQPACTIMVFSVYPSMMIPGRFWYDKTRESEMTVIRSAYRPVTFSFKPFSLLINLGFFLLAFIRGLGQVAAFHPELIHVHVLARHAILAQVLSAFLRIPYIVSEHWSRFLPETGFVPGRLHLALTRSAVRKAGALIPVSGHLSRALNSHGIGNDHTIIIGNAVDIDRFCLRDHPLTSPVKTILHVSCFDNRSKNISGLIRAIQLLVAKRDDFRLMLVGDGPDQPEIKDMVRTSGLAEKFVMFAGMLSGKGIVQAFHGADFLVQSSDYETFGTVVTEALSCGIPVVSVNTGIAPELVTAETGILVPPGSPGALAQAMDLMLGRCRQYNPPELRAMVKERFSRQVTGEKIIDVYQSLIRS